VQWHDILVALFGASSPIAFWQHSSAILLKQGWFYLTLITAILALLKPILKWEKKVNQLTELHTRYCDLYMDLKSLCEDMAAEEDLSPSMNSSFEQYRNTLKSLQRTEPPQDDAKTKKIQERVNREIDINQCWFPAKNEDQNGRREKDTPATTAEATI
jgi:hypothetical protein